jgi:hypothetical protein
MAAVVAPRWRDGDRLCHRIPLASRCSLIDVILKLDIDLDWKHVGFRAKPRQGLAQRSAGVYSTS